MPAANDNTVPAIPWSHIELSAGTITECYIDNGHIKRPLPTEIGQFRFFVDAVDEAGFRMGVDTLVNYDDAIRLAEEVRVDFGIAFPVKDTVAGSH